MKNGYWTLKRLIIGAILGITFIAVLVWYHIPFQKQITVVVINGKDNEISETVTFDLTISRSFLFPAKISGHLQFGDVAYRSWVTQEFSFFEKIKLKLKGCAIMPVWINASNIGTIGEPNKGITPERMLSDYIHTPVVQFDLHYNIKMLYLVKVSDGSSVWYDEGFYQWLMS